MAHFSVYVLVPGSTINVRRRVHHLVAPYHNDFAVEEYETDCYCDLGRNGFDPDCPNCLGTGNYLTTCNPMSKFDGYTIRDSMHALSKASKDPSDVDDIRKDDGAAIAPVSSLDLERLKLPFAIVTISGKWHEMDGGWWAKDQEWREWRKTVHDLLTRWPHAILVVLNCHS